MAPSLENLPKTTDQWVLKSRPQKELIINEHFELQRDIHLFPSTDPADLKGKILLKLEYFSNDPAQMTWMNKDVEAARIYVPPIQLGQPIVSGAVATVLESWDDGFQKGDVVYGYFAWATYLLAPAVSAFAPVLKLPPGVDPADYITFNLTAITAWVGLLEIAKASSETQTLVVTGAAGGVGTTIGQIAKKVLGIQKVIGICGSDEKCEYLTSEVGYDIALNYNSPGFHQSLDAATPDYIDLYIDNVGGPMLNYIAKRMKGFGKIVISGGISCYETEKPPMALEMDGYMSMIYNNVTLLAFVITNYLHLIPKITADLFAWAQEGKLKPLRTVLEKRIEDIPEGLKILLTGGNKGKLVTKLV